MLKKGMNFLKDQRGLTLIELLAVIVVLGIIAAIAVPAVGSVIDKSKVNADVQTIELVKSAALNYITVEGTEVSTSETAPTEVTIDSLVTGGYLTAAPNMQVDGAVAPTKVEIYIDSTDGYVFEAVSDDSDD